MKALPQSMLWASRNRARFPIINLTDRLREKQATLKGVDEKLARLSHKENLSTSSEKQFQKYLAMHNLLVRQIVQLKKETGHV